MKLRIATRRQVKLKVALSGPSGSGKTMSALLMAYGMTGSWGSIAVIDTENSSSELYAHLGDYNVITLEAPYTPERYVQAIEACEAEPTIEVIIIDSMTHEWEGKGGILEIKDSMTGNSFTNWGKITPRHNTFIDKILHTRLHVISTMRTKTDYVLVEKNGKQVPEKVGLKAITREGVEYEFTLAFDLDIKHNANASKDRTSLFMSQPDFVITPETGKRLKQWAESGVSILDMALEEVAACADVACTTAIWNKYPQLKEVAAFKEAVAKKGSSLKQRQGAQEQAAKEAQPLASDKQIDLLKSLMQSHHIPTDYHTKLEDVLNQEVTVSIATGVIDDLQKFIADGIEYEKNNPATAEQVEIIEILLENAAFSPEEEAKGKEALVKGMSIHKANLFMDSLEKKLQQLTREQVEKGGGTW